MLTKRTATTTNSKLRLKINPILLPWSQFFFLTKVVEFCSILFYMLFLVKSGNLSVKSSTWRACRVFILHFMLPRGQKQKNSSRIRQASLDIVYLWGTKVEIISNCWICIFYVPRWIWRQKQTKLLYFKIILTSKNWVHFHVTQVQITNNAHTFKIFSVLLFCDVFSCKLLTQVITQFLLQFGIISICKFFKVYKVLLTCRLVQLFFVFEKILSWCLSSPNCTQNHVIT